MLYSLAVPNWSQLECSPTTEWVNTLVVDSDNGTLLSRAKTEPQGNTISRSNLPDTMLTFRSQTQTNRYSVKSTNMWKKFLAGTMHEGHYGGLGMSGILNLVVITWVSTHREIHQVAHLRVGTSCKNILLRNPKLTQICLEINLHWEI